MTRPGMKMLTTTEERATDMMRNRNRASAAAGRHDVWVVVDGPEDGECTVMSLRDATDNEFLYRWEC